MFSLRFWRNFDWLLLGLTLILVVIGLIVIYSTSFKAATLSAPVDARNQVIFAGLGLATLFGMALVDYRLWAKFTRWLYPITLGLLILVKLLGKTVLGGTRWINLGFFQFQPSELAKIVLIIVLAKFISDHYDDMDRPVYLGLSILYMVLPFGLVLIQPDLGTGLVLVVIWLAMILASKVRKDYILGMAVAAVVALPLFITHLKPYQQARLATFFNPTANPLSTGYNVVQSTIAVGSGQLLGRGLASGSQSQLNFLPSQHTDFIFAVLSEKLGFVGGMLLFALFLGLLLRALVIASKARDRFGMFLAIGIVAMLLFHLLINAGMNMGIAPVTGIPLPFVSYGGTNLVVGMMAIGLLESVAIRHRKIQFGT